MGVSAVEQPGRFMDAPQIVRELGVSRSMADKIMRWCSKHGAGVIAPPDVRKVYVLRADVDAWITANTRKSA